MVRLVFRPYIQVWRTICTSVSLRASTRVSPGLTLLRYSSPSFGSQQVRSHSNTFPEINVGLWCASSKCCVSICIQEYDLFTCVRVWTPWSVFQDGPSDALLVNPVRYTSLWYVVRLVWPSSLIALTSRYTTTDGKRVNWNSNRSTLTASHYLSKEVHEAIPKC